MRERAISAAILVPVLLIVIGIGGPVLALAVALITAIAAVEVFRLLHGAGYAPFLALGTAFAVDDRPRRGLPGGPRGERAPARRRRHRPRRGRLVHQGRSARRPRSRGWRRSSVPSTSRCCRSSSGSATSAPDVPASAPLERRSARSVAGSCMLLLAVWAFDTGAYLVGRTFGRTKFLTHISPSKTVEGVVGGVVASTVVVGADAVGARPEPAPRPAPRAARPRSPRRPATSPNRSSSGRPAPRTRGR